MSKVKRLIILDLNGLLIHRLFKDDYIKSKSVLKTQYNRGRLIEPEIKGRFAIWFRPDVKDFLSWLMDHFHVAIWSSVLRHNIEPIVECLLPYDSDRERLLFWWNQEHCTVEEDPNATDPKKMKSFFKCLTSVWDDAEINDRWLNSQSNADINLRDHTLIIDDNISKVRDNPKFTAIHPRTWKLFEFVDGNPQEIRIFKDEVLSENGELRKWLEGLLKWDGTVAEYVENHPYHDPPIEEIQNSDDNNSSSWESSW